MTKTNLKNDKNYMKNDKDHRTNDKTTIETIHKPFKKWKKYAK